MDSLSALIQSDFDKFLAETPANDWVSYSDFFMAWVETWNIIRRVKK